jgi:hypothetical protein
MPYSVGEKGSYGCSGYPVVKDGTSEVMGCHETAQEATMQIVAIEANEDKTYEEKEVVTSGGGVGIKNPQAWPNTEIKRPRKKLDSALGQPEPADYRESMFNWSTPVRRPERSSFRLGKSEYGDVMKEIKEGDFVMGPTVDGMVFGRVEHIMWEGGTLGEAGTEYALESMPPENPAMSVRVFEVEENEMEATPYSIGMMYQDAQAVDISSMTMEQENEMEMMSKAEAYSPNDGMKAAARRAIKWKEDGEATGAGTPVGWGRARDIVAGRSMSLSVVRRMFSFFSRHEVDKQADGFSAGEEGYPSNGRIMWDAWGGDAGFSWSRAIVERNREKSLGSDIFEFTNVSKVKEEYADKRNRTMEARKKQSETIRDAPQNSYIKGKSEESIWNIRDLTKTQNFVVKADSVRVGQMVSWNSSGGRAQGKVTRVIRSGSYNVPNSDFVINGTEENPAVVITLYRDGKPTDTTVAHRMSTLRAL